MLIRPTGMAAGVLLILASSALGGPEESPAAPPPETTPRLVVQESSARLSPDDVPQNAWLSSDGRRMLAAGRLWDTVTGRELRRFKGDLPSSFSPDGRCVLSPTQLLDAATGRELGALHGAGGDFNACCAACSPDNRYVVTGSGAWSLHDLSRGSKSGAILWDVTTGKPIHRFDHPGMVAFVAISGDGRLVVTRAEQSIRVWEAVSGKQVAEIVGHEGPITYSAMSPDGKRILTTSGKTARLWDDATGQEIQRFEGHTGALRVATFAPDGRQVLTGSADKTARLWDAATGKEIRRFEGHTNDVWSVAFSPAGKQVLTGSADGTARVWDAAAGQEIQHFGGHASVVHVVAFGPEGRQVLTASEGDPACSARLWDLWMNRRMRTEGAGGPVRLWDAATGKEIRRSEEAAAVHAAAFAPFGVQVLAADPEHKKTRLWNAGAENEVVAIDAEVVEMADDRVAFSPDGDRVLTTSGKAARLWDAAVGKEVQRFEGHTEGIWWAGLSPDGKQALTGNYADGARLWDIATGKAVGRSDWKEPLFMPDGKQVLTCESRRKPVVVNGVQGEEVVAMCQLRDVGTGEVVRQFEAPDGMLLAVTPDGRRVLFGSDGSFAHIYDLATGKQIDSRIGGSTQVSVTTMSRRIAAFSPDGKRFMVGGGYAGKAIVGDAATGEVLQELAHDSMVTSVAFSPDGRFLLTASGRQVKLWDAIPGKELCSLVLFGDGSWVVSTPEGRFDASDLDAVNGVHWVVPDDPFRPLPPEIFMRDYYEPRLLSRILAGESFKPIRSLASLNRVQPVVEIAKVEAQPDQPGEAMVTVEVASQSATLNRGGKPVTLDSGVFDLQLLRDGRLVGWRPETEGPVPLDPKTGRATLRFEHVQAPRKADGGEIEFSAYAFNADRVKSPTHRVAYRPPAEVAARKGTAYLVCMGVNAFDRPAWDLHFAAADARAISGALQEGLSRSGRYERVAVVTLISEAGAESGKRTLLENTAVKDNLRTALALLAGRPVEDKARRRLPGADALHKARPEDLVLLAFSTHGYNGAEGQFYLFPADVGEGEGADLDEAALRRAVSTDELTLWLRDVDAGDMVMIIDACHSAASVDQEGFKPGPMGSRGLGQLAYSKRMRILAASQAADVALEDPQIGHGLLSYALCEDGLKKGRADFQPRDRRITMAEWLRYGVRRVPELAEEVAAGKVRAFSSTGRDLTRKDPEEKGVTRRDDRVRQRRLAAQQPSLFDFTKGDEGALLREEEPPTEPAAPHPAPAKE